jgi:hypothetical protein
VLFFSSPPYCWLLQITGGTNQQTMPVVELPATQGAILLENLQKSAGMCVLK